MSKKKDYAEAIQVELRRLNVSLVGRRIRRTNRTFGLTDKQLALFLRRVDCTGADGCWMWRGACNRKGYGQFSVGASETTGLTTSTFRAHRVAYELLKGSIPAGLTLDHLCRVRPCVNPDHLEPCTSAENSRRSPDTLASINRARTTCPQGHPLDGAYKSGPRKGRRFCKTCQRKWSRQSYVRRHERAPLAQGGKTAPSTPETPAAVPPWTWKGEVVPLWTTTADFG